ncbi:flagellar type III secretion system pore protein FliP [Anaerocolumna xylanovorans]|uniref:Flagellar biosynthetic protein FliP n=1 Tax=Anaerocolumna xylanovorans DSM 12503 TaxID=1121345 RepID=A0A1M7YBE4_9FIRM|nr:flagellar type III secretion system pore protein FliP [Anaerocolumna xylanovorans]SHO49848.1 flagellar biosynthetic protein FliP [Anaerocolumna xylanovorans DSM 12503]
MESKNKKTLKKLVCIICILFITGILTNKTTVFVYASQTSETAVTGADNDNQSQQDNSAETGNNLSGQIGPFKFNMDTDPNGGGITSTLQIMLVITLISLAPSILIMVTSFTRIIIVLHFVRSALGTQTTPPNQVLIGLALFLTFFIMSPVFTQVNNDAIKPLSNGEITQQEAFDAGIKPLRQFMLKEVKAQDLKLFMDIAEIGKVDNLNDIPITVIIPSFIISELRTAFIIGFVIYIPFIIIDMVVASTLMSMGMMMLPPTTISMPFKILLFILADGWNLVIGVLVKTFYT